MFSSRTEWNLRYNRLTALLQQKRSRGEAIINLTATNPLECGLLPPGKFLGLYSNREIISYSPSPLGLLHTRAAISRFYAASGHTVSENSIVLTSSTSEAYSYLFRLLCNPGERVLIPRPGYPLFDILTGLADIQIGKYDLTYDGEWSINRDSLVRQIDAQTKAIIVIHPSNPAGSYVSTSDREFLFSIAKERQLALIVDEVFHSFPIDPLLRVPQTFAQTTDVPTFVLNGLSKLAGLPQMKLAWLIVMGPSEWQAGALSRLEMIADSFLSVSTASQVIATSVLRDEASYTHSILARIRQNHESLKIGIPNECSLLRCDAGWHAVLRMPSTSSDEEWCLRLLDRHNVLLHPGYLFDCREGPFVVLSLLPLPELFQDALNRLPDAF